MLNQSDHCYCHLLWSNYLCAIFPVINHMEIVGRKWGVSLSPISFNVQGIFQYSYKINISHANTKNNETTTCILKIFPLFNNCLPTVAYVKTLIDTFASCQLILCFVNQNLTVNLVLIGN